MNWILDGAVILLMLIVTIAGIRKGIVRSAAEFLGAIASAITASWLGGLLSVWVYDRFFREGLYERVLKASNGKEGAETVSSIFSALPDFVVRLLETNGITESSVVHTVGGASAQAAQKITDVLSPVFITIIKVFAVIILFILFMTVIKGIASLLNRVCRLPVLAQLNGLLGGVFGFCLSVILVWLIVGVLNFVSPVLSPKMKSQVDSAVKDSVVADVVVSLNPLNWIFE
ncbi:MAG: CvpA family protein [Oscillospiraceae bacterium]